MKKNSLFILFLFSFTTILFSQKNIIYNPHTNSFTGNKETVKKGEKINIYIKNFNPFLYSYNVSITTKNDTKKLFEFISNIINKKYGVENSLSDIKSDNFSINSNFSLNDFLELQRQYLSLEYVLKNPFFQCKNINALNNSIKDDLYLKYIDLKEKDSVLSEEKILKLSNLKVNLDYYLKHKLDTNKCLLKVAEFKASGSSNLIKVNLSSKEENNISIISDSIVGTHKIDIKNALKVDFSSGLFFTQNNEPQYFKIQNSNNNYVIDKEKINKYQLGINALAHIYLTKKNNFNFNLGSGITIDKAIHLLTGISYKFENSNIMLNLGADFSNYNELSDAFEIGKEYATDITITKKKRWNNALWFGISYKL